MAGEEEVHGSTGEGRGHGGAERDDASAGGVGVRDATTDPAPGLPAVPCGTTDAPGGVIGGLARYRHEDARLELTVVGGEVEVPGCRDDRDVQVDEGLEVGGATGQAVQVVGDDH